MTKTQIYSLMTRCTRAQLDAVTKLLGLNPAFLPGSGAIATRAAKILELVEQQNLLAKLEELLRERFPGQPTLAPILKPKCILVLSVNPLETERLQIDEEVQLIKERLSEAEQGRAYKIATERAVRTTDVSNLLLKYKPVIVHFSGYGCPTGEIVLQDGMDKAAAPLAVSRLASLFETLRSSTECVVLNACYSLDKANVLSNYVGCVIGMEKSIGDPSALRFAAGFYRGLAFGKDYHTAFLLGCNEIDLVSLPDASVPHYTTLAEDRIAARSVGAGVSDTVLAAPVRTWFATGGAVIEQDPHAPRLYPVWFCTDRRPKDEQDLTKGFSEERERNDPTLHLGICKVAIPKSHKFGSTGSAWWKRFLTLTDDRIGLKGISPLGREEFWASARAAVAQVDAGQRIALVFIHGFNVTFEEAAIRTAQIGFDLKVPGITGFFSWPSKGRLGLIDYTADEASVESSEQKISKFLVDFARESQAERVHVMAHSMGNRGLLRSMQRIVAAAATAARKPFHHIIFAAPDVDAAVFRDLAKAHAHLANRATMYVSSHDRAVKSSGILHDAPRAGFVPPVTIVDGIDTIEVSNADLTLLGHGYYGAAAGVLYDMHELLIHDAPAKSRTRLSSVANYWQISR